MKRALSTSVGLVACALGLVAVGPAAGAARDACPTATATQAADTPPVVSYPADSVLVGSTSAQLGALIDQSGGATGYQVEYGLSTDYGSCTAPSALAAGSSQQPVGTTLTGLTPATTYHVRVIATGPAGSVAGADETITTLPANEIAQGTTVDRIAVGGMDETSATLALRSLTAAPLRLQLGKQRWSVPRSALGARLNATAVVAAALQALPSQTLSAPISVDRQRLTRYLTTASRRHGVAPQPAVVRLAGQHAVVRPAKPGLGIQVQRARQKVARALVGGRTAPVLLPWRRVAPPAVKNGKTVVIRLAAQTLTAYLDGKTVLRTPVTTGRPALPTPVGSFFIHSRYSPYTFISPWPKGNPYWYPPTPVTWAMYFYDNDFLHDDPGEPASAFGRGSENGPYASHGCVHVPHDAMAFLYRWLPMGATVIVAQS